MIEGLAKRGTFEFKESPPERRGTNEDGCDLGKVAVKKGELEVRAPGLRGKLKAHVSKEAGKPEIAQLRIVPARNLKKSNPRNDLLSGAYSGGPREGEFCPELEVLKEEKRKE